MGLRPGAADPSFFGGAVAAAVPPISGAWDLDIKQEPQDALLESRGPRGLEPNSKTYITTDRYWKQQSVHCMIDHIVFNTVYNMVYNIVNNIVYYTQCFLVTFILSNWG